jgi:hypothetical protein
MKKDHFLTGFIPGLLLPLPGIYIYYLLFFPYMGFRSFLNHISKSDLLISVISIGVILNLGLFFLFYRMEIDRSAKGVIGATFIYAFIVLYFKVLSR